MIDKGYLLADRYKIVDTLGEGGMANVYLAEDIILQRKVAVKVLRMDLQNDQKTVQRFQREALATSELSHPNIVSILDVGSEKGMQYLVMEYVDGPNLKEYIHDHNPLTLTRVIEIMDQMLSAIALAHQHNVIHRDLKPQNILMDPSGRVKVADFGIAIALSQQSITQTNSLLGSVHYMSPEQARGSMATKQSDIYSLGIILYELITGDVPFGGETAVSIALKHFQENVPSIKKQHPEVPQALENVVLQATAKDPRDRFETVSEMKNDLDTAMDPSRAAEPVFLADHNPELDKTIVLPDLNGVVTETNNDADKPKNSALAKFKASFKKHQFWWIFSAIAALMVVFALVFALSRNGTVEVPDVTNMSRASAIGAIQDAGLVVGDIDEQPSNSVKKGNVIRTLPEKNMSVKSGAEIGLVVSSGVGLTTVPDVVGTTYSRAKTRLEKFGFTVTKRTEDSNAPKNEIIDQSVTAGKKVDAAKTTIVLTVSRGPEVEESKDEPVTLRDLSGYTLKSAQDYANENKLQLSSSEEFSSTVDKGQIISQTPGAGTKVQPGTTIKVVVSKGQNKSVTKSYALTYNSDNDNNGRGNHVIIYIGDDTHTTTSVYKDMYITSDSSVSIPFTLNNGNGHVKIVQDGQTVVDESVTE